MASSVEPRRVTNSEAQASEARFGTSFSRIAGDSRSVANWVLLSRITGFGRVAAIAAVLGPTFFGNLYQISAVLPSTLYGLLSGSLMSALLVPPLVRRIEAGDSQGVGRFANGALGVMATLLLAVAVLVLMLSPLLLRALAVGVEAPEMRAQHLHLGILLLAMLLPQMALYGLAGISVAVQQAHGRFALAAAAPALENLGVIGVLGVWAVGFGIGSDLGQIGTLQLLWLGCGTTAAVALHAGVQWWGAYRVGVTLVPAAGWREPEIIQVLRRAGSSIGYTSCYWVAYLALLFTAGTVPGGASAFQLAANLCQLPVALTAASLAAAQLPRLAAHRGNETLDEFRAGYENGLRLVMFAAIPAGLLLLAIPRSLAQLAAFGAMDSAAGATLLVACIGSLGISVVGEAALVVSTSACYARNDVTAPLQAMALRLAIAGIGVVVARLSFAGPALLFALGISQVAASSLSGLFLHWRLVRALPRNAEPVAPDLRREMVLATASVLPAMLVAHWLGSHSNVLYWRVTGGMAAVLTAMFLYLALQFLRGSRELVLLFPVVVNIPSRWQIWKRITKETKIDPISDVPAPVQPDILPQNR